MAWRATSVADRARIAGRLRRLAWRITRRRSPGRSPACGRVAESLAAEVLPLAEAARFLAAGRRALLAPRRLGWRGRPLWLFGVDAEIRREPCGVVLILAPVQLSLFLPGRAGAAGARRRQRGLREAGARLHGAAWRRWPRLLAEAGLPPGVLHLLDESAGDRGAASRAGFDRIVLTGSAATGAAVLAAAAPRLTPATMELSGNDAVFVLPGADLDRAGGRLAYGLRLNGGATCIAPRRVFAPARG